MSRTQVEAIRAACRAYIVPLSDSRHQTRRYTIYLQQANGEELTVLWPSDTHLPKPKLLPYQVHTKRESLPAFHFSLMGGGYSAMGELKEMLLAINKKIKVSGLTPGEQPRNPL